MTEKKNNDYLYERLVKLGDLMGDGCHLESDGKWIEKEYKDTMRLLGYLPQKTMHRDSNSINEFMDKRLQSVNCECGGKLSQSRKGSFIAKCNVCGKRYKLGARKRRNLCQD